MRALREEEILHVWETGLGQHATFRALTLLAVVCPETPIAELAALSIGQRDARLLDAREQTFGSRLNCVAQCPECREWLEVSLEASEIRDAEGRFESQHQPPLQQLTTADGYVVEFRLPNSHDLALLSGCNDLQEARALLIERCISKAMRDGVVVQGLPEQVISELGAQMSGSDPQADVGLDLSCAVCGASWGAIFDIASFFWAELCAIAKRLLREVDVLARAYGWREADILALSNTRRQFYIELANSST